MLEDILNESWAFQEIMQKGIEQGREQEREEAKEKELERLQQVLFSFVQARFPDLKQLAEQQALTINLPDQLQKLILKVGLAKDEQEAQQYLFNVKLMQEG